MEPNSESKTLADELPREMSRVREILGEYKKLGHVGAFGAVMIEQDLRAADHAVMSGDVLQMLRSLSTLRDISW